MPRILVECQGPEDDTSALPPPRWMHVDAARPALGRGPPMIQAELTQYYAGLATA